MTPNPTPRRHAAAAFAALGLCLAFVVYVVVAPVALLMAGTLVGVLTPSDAAALWAGSLLCALLANVPWLLAVVVGAWTSGERLRLWSLWLTPLAAIGLAGAQLDPVRGGLLFGLAAGLAADQALSRARGGAVRALSAVSGGLSSMFAIDAVWPGLGPVESSLATRVALAALVGVGLLAASRGAAPRSLRSTALVLAPVGLFGLVPAGLAPSVVPLAVAGTLGLAFAALSTFSRAESSGPRAAPVRSGPARPR